MSIVAEALVERFRSGHSVAELTLDGLISTEELEDAIRDALDSQADRLTNITGTLNVIASDPTNPDVERWATQALVDAGALSAILQPKGGYSCGSSK